MQEDLIMYEMIDYNLKVAQKLLEDFGEFYPIACIRKIGTTASQTVAAHFGDENPGSTEVIHYLLEALNSDLYKGKIIGACICVNVQDIQSEAPALDFWVNIVGFDGIKVTWPYEFQHRQVSLGSPNENDAIVFLDRNDVAGLYE